MSYLLEAVWFVVWLVLAVVCAVMVATFALVEGVLFLLSVPHALALLLIIFNLIVSVSKRMEWLWFAS